MYAIQEYQIQYLPVIRYRDNKKTRLKLHKKCGIIRNFYVTMTVAFMVG